MIKKIAADKLKVGMFIHDLDASWINHPFLSSRFSIKNKLVINEVIAAGIKHVYIDTERGLDYELAEPFEVIKRRVESRRQQLAEEQVGLPKQVSFKSELIRAQVIMQEACSTVRTFMCDIRFGRHLESDVINEVVESITESVFRNKDALMTLSRIKKVDQYTFMHSISVCVLMTAFARAMDYDSETTRQIAVGSLLHDLGKMRVSPEILNKPGPLTEDEHQEMRRHVEYGEELLDELGWMGDLSMNIIRQHHERIDGTGYPHGLVDEELSDVGRMSAVVDVYDALTSNRCYKKSWEPTYTLGKLLEWSPNHFGEAVTHQFVRCVGIYPVGTLVRLNTGKLAVVVEQDEEHLLQPRVRVVFDEEFGRAVLPSDIDLAMSDMMIDEAVAPEKVKIDPKSFL